MMERLKIALPVMAGAMASLPTLAQASTDRSLYWDYGGDWGWGHMISGSLMMILFWGGLIVLIVLAVRWAGSGASQGGGSPSSTKRGLDILCERFARGEIDRQEFEERRSLLAD
ncbi:hypothetical protein VSX64_14270 [Aurantimonas sp. C2-6-R+9]|nr:hypothetical protein [Aurantimonas sp. C2-6-R+9]